MQALLGRNEKDYVIGEEVFVKVMRRDSSILKLLRKGGRVFGLGGIYFAMLRVRMGWGVEVQAEPAVWQQLRTWIWAP